MDPEYLSKLGVLYHHCPSVDAVNTIAVDRSYKNRDEIIVSSDKMGTAYEDKVKMFFNEHLHEDEEIRYILDGEGFFDVRGVNDEWVRIRLAKGDLIILPPGIYHRFTTDSKNVRYYTTLILLGSPSLIYWEKYIKAIRLFKDEPKWTPLNRAPELDGNPARQEYLTQH